MHNSFIGCYHRVGLRSLYMRLMYCIFWLGSGVAWGLNIIAMKLQTFYCRSIDIGIGLDLDIDIYRFRYRNRYRYRDRCR